MSDWLEQYSAALDMRDAREQAHKPYIDAYTKLADRTAAATTSDPRSTSPRPSSERPSTTPSNATEQLHSLRADLAHTQKARGALQTRVDELTAQLSTLRTAQQASTGELAQLSRQKALTERRLRDREEELRAKAELVTGAQDEMVALELQLHMAERRGEALERENKELVERWMRRVGEEAERLNRDSRWGE